MGRPENFHFQEGLPYEWGREGGNSLGEGSYSSAYYDIFLATYKSLRFVTFLSISLLNNADRL